MCAFSCRQNTSGLSVDGKLLIKVFIWDKLVTDGAK